MAFDTAWRRAQGLRVPLALAQLEISDARLLRAAGQPRQAVARLRSARQRLITLSARPHLEICDRQPAAPARPWNQKPHPPSSASPPPSRPWPASSAPGGPTGKPWPSDISVKTYESHLGHIYDKLGILSGNDLITRISGPQPSNA